MISQRKEFGARTAQKSKNITEKRSEK